MREKTIRGLLIEDDPNDALLFMNHMKGGHGSSDRFTFEQAGSLKQGFETLSLGRTDVVLLDVQLPDSRGIETVQKLRARFPDVPVVVLTGLADEAVGIEALRIGAQDYQLKGGIDGHSLKRTISYAVERHRMLARMETIIEKSADGMVVVDAEGRVLRMNPAAESLFGVTQSELLGKPFPQPILSSPSAEIRIPLGDSKTRIAEMRVSEIEWDEMPARLALIRDITELRRIEQRKAEIKERKAIDRLKDELMSTVSHEMRNPLTVIKVVACGIRDALKEEMTKQQLEMMEMQYRNIQRLEKIVSRILDLSRLESGKATITPQPVDAVLLIHDTIQGFVLMDKKPKIEIVADLPRGLHKIYADPDLFVQVLNNLIDNGMRFAHSRIAIRAEEVDAQLEERSREKPSGAPLITAKRFVSISVTDDGEGIPRERIPDLFNKFVQVNRSAQDDGYKGTGLGLAICKEIVERHGGRIWVESAEGIGSAFRFEFPAYSRGLVKVYGGA